MLGVCNPVGDRKGAQTHTFMVCAGEAVLRSQKRKVVSPEPVARRLPSGLNAVDSTASAWPAIGAAYAGLNQSKCDSRLRIATYSWKQCCCQAVTCQSWPLNVLFGHSLLCLPGIEAVHRDTGRTLKTACGWYRISSAVSTDTFGCQH